MAWYLARSLTKLLAQVNTAYPGRSKVSDGQVGDPAHQARGTASDHNPLPSGQVCALDLTHDPGRFDAHALAEHLLKNQDPRLKYVISKGRIGSGPGGTKPGVWRAYTGANPHDKHCHISVKAGETGDLALPWSIAARTVTTARGGTVFVSIFTPPAGTAGAWVACTADGKAYTIDGDGAKFAAALKLTPVQVPGPSLWQQITKRGGLA